MRIRVCRFHRVFWSPDVKRFCIAGHVARATTCMQLFFEMFFWSLFFWFGYRRCYQRARRYARQRLTNGPNVIAATAATGAAAARVVRAATTAKAVMVVRDVSVAKTPVLRCQLAQSKSPSELGCYWAWFLQYIHVQWISATCIDLIEDLDDVGGQAEMKSFRLMLLRSQSPAWQASGMVW